jgi:hypothetical protein
MNPAWVYRDLDKDDRNSVRQCNSVILKQCGVYPASLRNRARDFRATKIARLIQTFNEKKEVNE